jgi:hypothetical protein
MVVPKRFLGGKKTSCKNIHLIENESKEVVVLVVMIFQPIGSGMRVV